MVNLWIALTLGVIFIIIPIVVMGMAGVNMVGKMMKGLFSMALRVGIIGSIVYWLVQWDSIALDIVFVIIMLFYSAIEVKVKARLRSTSYVLPAIAGLFVGTILTGVGMSLVNITSLAALSARFMLLYSLYCSQARLMCWLARCLCTTPDCVITTNSTIICLATALRITRRWAISHAVLCNRQSRVA